MKQALLLMGFAAAALLAVAAPNVHAQDATDTLPPFSTYTTTIPLHGGSTAKARNAVGSNAAVVNGATIPMWNYSVTSPIDGNVYSGTMVGSSPYFNGARTTKIPTVVVPLIIEMPDGGKFDPTAPDNCTSWGNSINQILASPIFQPAQFTMNGINMGSGQYIDEFQRANFYNANVAETGDSYHTVLSPVTTLAAQTVTIPANMGQTTFLGGCALVGIMDLGTFDSIITNTVLPQLTASGLVSPTSFPMFILHDVVMGDPGTSISSNCCVVGYHSATGFPVQTYVVSDFDTSRTFQNNDIQPLSHAVGGWMDDPLGTNPTPSWGHVGQVTQCQRNLEVGHPLSGSPPSFYSQGGNLGVTMANGHTYYPQGLAFFSWFYRQSPSLGAGGLYSNVGWMGSEGFICQ